MNSETKNKLYETIKSEISLKECVSSIEDINDNKNYHLSFIIYNRLKTELTLMKNGDMLKIVTIQNYPELNDKELYELAQVITADTKINFTTYQDQLKLQTIYPFANIDNDDEAKQGCIDTINKFIEALGKNEEKLGKEIGQIKEKGEKELTVESVDEKDINVESKDTSNKLNDNKDNSNKEVSVSYTDNTKTAINCEIQTKEKSELSSDFQKEKIKNNEQNNETNEKKLALDNKNSDISKQMDEMYEELDRVFKHRKEMADYRENTLNKLKETLELKEKEIKDLINNKDKIFEEQDKKLEDKKLEIEASQKKLDFNWKTFKDEKEAFEREKAEFEKLKELEKSISSI